ncbi:uncharacterized protein LOC124301757 [Neodiprion virginianus]|uniref:Uncharacterized protein LOC107221872 n=1 Tax=Neodiprion lecontei TaxID=441921 RepID=A0A6J0BP72_NEOLC|nr:uncharacterized protein LOC107221872 [Neodiprion lecontei]XP_046420881.1 uncharacterized protein LOC124179988 [Neodiprion fabricii]XP_046420882.1 uncharacterized protein LOC124179988 [Neodiprion fabricii]XP_046420884.1 uncharacterized protein LOC124179988 [Neodiprion fabricii]XP_046420885.1 uncharacterized protein LOC124179988 [Neodiprion fabricii]XP_046420886.1 uncharacterized protein LOC124179988 [Neodiprion fabricii]XP_046420887.1 uncharacterized protein LOC124179988 [Neodiprion fabrici
MTVMLLQRSATPQSTHSQNNNNNNSTKPPFLFLLEQGAAEQRNNINNNNKSATINRNNSVVIGNLTAASSQNRNIGGGDLGGSIGVAGGQIPGEDIAMRYYRLWIYACNVVLLGSALGFVAAGARTLIFSGDTRRRLVPGVPGLFDPTTLYAVLALVAQLGLVQLLGCVAARRLSARLLNAYWLLLLALLFGDAVVGVAWVFRFEKMRAELRPTLRLRLQTEYGKETRFSEQWDRLQREFGCCGVTGPRDFTSRWPQSCCFAIANMSDTCQQPYSKGCDESLLRWLRRTADLLFVLGFCVIAFTKLCFLGILRYEIREMIQKIRLLREPPPPPTPFAQPLAQIVPDPTNNNGSILRRTTLQPTTASSGNATLLLQPDECGGGRHPLLAHALQDGGADSDTNSHCALILEETNPSPANHNCTSKEKSNGNNNYEMREFNRRLLFSNGNSQVLGVGGTVQNRHT